jgi:hypothetical protein
MTMCVSPNLNKQDLTQAFFYDYLGQRPVGFLNHDGFGKDLTCVKRYHLSSGWFSQTSLMEHSEHTNFVDFSKS